MTQKIPAKSKGICYCIAIRHVTLVNTKWLKVWSAR